MSMSKDEDVEIEGSFNFNLVKSVYSKAQIEDLTLSSIATSRGKETLKKSSPWLNVDWAPII